MEKAVHGSMAVRFKSKRSKACDIPLSVKIVVNTRDGGRCIFCGSYDGQPNAHYIPRSQGGLGIEENIVTACWNCHTRMDNTTDRPKYLRAAENYLRSMYPNWDPKQLIYSKWR